MAMFVDGRRDAADHHARVAIRLDPGSLSGQYVRNLLMESSDGTEAAAGAMQELLAQPLGDQGMTLGSALSRRHFRAM